MKNNSKIAIMIIAIIAAASAVYAILFFAVLFVLEKSAEKYSFTYETTKLDEYGDWTDHFDYEMDSINEKLYLFPETIPNKDDSEYYYKAEVVDSIDSGIIFAKVKYDEDDYRNEVVRLSQTACKIEVDDYSVINRVDYSESLFAYPAYIAIYDCIHSYEYALLDKEHTSITYVYMQGMIPLD